MRAGVRRVVAMEVVSGLGDGVFWVGLAAVLIGRNSGAQAFTLAALARLGPRALISAPAGVLADRVDRRRLLVGLDLRRGAVMALLAVTAAAHGPLPLILVMVLGSYTLAAPYRPALTAALPAVAGESGLAAANAMVSTVRQLMTFIGPLVGAVVVEVWSPTVAFAVNAGSFAVAATLIASVDGLSGRRRVDDESIAEHRAHWVHDIKAGWHEMTQRAGLTVITVLVFAMYVARGAELMLFVLLADQRLDLGAPGVGVLTGAVGLGALAVLPIARRVANSDSPAVLVFVSVGATALPFLVLSVTHSLVVASGALVALGAGVVVFELISVVLLQRLVRRETLGAVFGLVGTVSNAAKLIGALAAPLLAARFGIGTAMAVGGIAIAVLAVACIPGLARLSRGTRARHDQLRPITAVLASLALFESASQPVLERIASAIEVAPIDAGTVVVRQGDEADYLYIAREGHFEVFDGDVRIHEVRAGEWFGEIGLLQQRPRTATVVADVAAVVWRIPGDLFLDALEDGASEPTMMVEVMADRLARSRRFDA